MKHVQLILLCLLTLPKSWALPASAESSPDYSAIVEQAIQSHAQPRFEQLEQTTDILLQEVSLTCKAAQTLDQPQIKQAFSQTVAAWSSVHHLRWGPAQTDYRHERFSFGADPANYVSRQLGRLIMAEDTSLLDPATLATKSIAIQGLTAFELLMVTPPISENKSAYHCALAQTIAVNLNLMAINMSEAWQSSEGYTALLRAPDPEHLFIQTNREAAQEFYKPLAGGIRFLIDIDLKDPMQNEIDRARPSHAAFWRSDNARQAIGAKLTALEAAYRQTGFESHLKAKDPRLNQQILKHFGSASAAYQKIDRPIAQAVKDKRQRRHMLRMINELDQLWQLIVYDMAADFNFIVGFNEFDGD